MSQLDLSNKENEASDKGSLKNTKSRECLETRGLP